MSLVYDLYRDGQQIGALQRCPGGRENLISKNDLTIEECHVLPDGSREDVCNECAEHERLAMEAFHKPMASPDDLTIDAGENGPLRTY